MAAVHPPLHVVAGVLADGEGRVLLAARPSGKDHAGLWEFPGGKVEPGETPVEALRRELAEELGIRLIASEPLIRIPWTYPARSILLDVHRVLACEGTPEPRECQSLRWVHPEHIDSAGMPAADRPVLAALRLPRAYAISPEPDDDETWLPMLDRQLADGVRLVQLRSKLRSGERLRVLARTAQDRVRAAGAHLLVNAHVALARELDLDGVHLTSVQLRAWHERPLPVGRWVGASCHDAEELDRAVALGADFVCLGPVLPTASHPGGVTLGWDGFARLCSACPLPVYALGGVGPGDLDTARRHGAFGIAGISAFRMR